MSNNSTDESGAAPDSDFHSSALGNGRPSGAAGVSNRRLEMVPPSRLVTDKRNARTHSKKQIDQIARSIERFGFLGAVLADDRNQIIAGHGRVEAAKRLGLNHVPVLRATHLSAVERRAYAIADNRLAELAGWDAELLAIGLEELRELDFDIAAIGFELDEVGIACNALEQTGGQSAPKTDRGACTSGGTVSRADDIWLLGPHQLRCGDADADDTYACVDAAIQRWQRVAGKTAMLAGAGKTFAQIQSERSRTAADHSGPSQAPTEPEAA